MSRLKKSFKDHAVHEAINNVREMLDMDPVNFSAEVLWEWKRFVKVFSLIEEAVQNVDEEITPQSFIDNFNTTLRHNNLVTSLQSFKDSNSVGHIRAANNQIDGALANLIQILPQVKQDRTFETRLANTIEELVERSAQYLDQVKKMEARITQLDRTMEKMEAGQTTLQNQQTEKMAEWNAAFTASEATRESSFKQELENTRTEYIQKLKALIAEAEQSRERISQLEDIVAGESVGVEYAKDANIERNSSNLWRRLSVLFILLAAISVALSLFIPNSGQWQNLVKVASITGLLVLASGYAGRQSKRHRDEEQRLRKFALEVKAFDPFIASLDDDQKKLQKIELAKKLFGDPPTAPSDVELSPKDIVELLKTAIKRAP